MSFGWSASDITKTVEILIEIGKALRESDGAESRFREATLFLESLATTLDQIEKCNASLLIEEEVLTIKQLVDAFCDELKKRFDKTLGTSQPRDWKTALRAASSKVRYALFDAKRVQEFKDRIAVPLQGIQIKLGLHALNEQNARKLTEAREWVNPKLRKPVEESFEKNLGEISKDSCMWLFGRSEYMSWYDRSQSTSEPSLLWVTGIPGSGKTHLATRTIQKLQKSHIVPYFYCDSSDVERCSPLSILRAWVWQLLLQQPHIPAVIVKEKTKGAQPTTVSMKDCLIELLSTDYGHLSCVLVLDALDECPPKERREICEFLAVLAKHASILLFSRPDRDISNVLTAAQTPIAYSQLQISELDTEQDIADYLKASVETRLKIPDEAQRLEIITTLCDRAKGMFQWAALMVETLAGDMFFEDHLQTLNSLPDGLDELYGRILGSLLSNKYWERSRCLLQWLACAERPLNVDELGCVLSITIDEPMPRSFASMDLEGYIRQLCGVLVDFKSRPGKSSIVTLIHASVKDFLLDSLQRLKPCGSLIVDPIESHTLLARSCVTYLCYNSIAFAPFEVDALPTADATTSVQVQEYVCVRNEIQERFRQHLQKYPFLEYATLHWLSHFRKGSHSLASYSSLKQMLLSPVNNIRWLQLSLTLFHDFDVTIESSQDLNDAFIKAHPTEEANFKPLLESIRRTRTNILYRFYDYYDAYLYPSALHIAAYFGYDEFLQAQLSRGTDPNVPTLAGLTPLSYAAAGGSSACIRSLTKADKNMKCSRIIKNGHSKLAKKAIFYDCKNANIPFASLLFEAVTPVPIFGFENTPAQDSMTLREYLSSYPGRMHIYERLSILYALSLNVFHFHPEQAWSSGNIVLYFIPNAHAYLGDKSILPGIAPSPHAQQTQANPPDRRNLMVSLGGLFTEIMLGRLIGSYDVKHIESHREELERLFDCQTVGRTKEGESVTPLVAFCLGLEGDVWSLNLASTETQFWKSFYKKVVRVLAALTRQNSFRWQPLNN